MNNCKSPYTVCLVCQYKGHLNPRKVDSIWRSRLRRNLMAHRAELGQHPQSRVSVLLWLLANFPLRTSGIDPEPVLYSNEPATVDASGLTCSWLNTLWIWWIWTPCSTRRLCSILIVICPRIKQEVFLRRSYVSVTVPKIEFSWGTTPRAIPLERLSKTPSIFQSSVIQAVDGNSTCYRGIFVVNCMTTKYFQCGL